MRPHRSNPGEIVFLLVATVISFSFFQLSHLEGTSGTATALEGARLAQESTGTDTGEEFFFDLSPTELPYSKTNNQYSETGAGDVYPSLNSRQNRDRTGAQLPDKVPAPWLAPQAGADRDTGSPHSILTVRETALKTLGRARDAVVADGGRLGTFLRTDRTDSLAHHDTDGDGLIDFDEVVLYGTDPQNPQTAGVVATDGELVASLRDPRDPGRAIEPEDPRTAGAAVFEELAVESASVFIVEGEERVRFAGRALPHSVVTLYLYSEPTIVRVRANAEGRWEHTLSARLTQGRHTAYVALTDAEGTIHAQSLPMPLVKDARGITFVASAADDLALARSRGVVASTYPTLIALLTLLAFVVALLLLGARARESVDYAEHG